MKSIPFIALLLLVVSYTVYAQKTDKLVAKGKGKTEIAVIETNLGTIELELLRKEAPKTVENFVQLAKRNYYNGVRFHRIAKDFVIQAGDPTGTGSGGESIYGKMFEDEINRTSALYTGGYKRGTVAMANMGRANTNSSQFFIVVKDASFPPSYTIFGRVRKGMDVVDKINAVDIIPIMGPTDGKPKEDVTMTKVYLK